MNMNSQFQKCSDGSASLNLAAPASLPTLPGKPPRSKGLLGESFWASLSLSVAACLNAGCVSPIGADRVTTRQAYEQVEANALRTGKLSAETDSLLHRYSLDLLAVRQPDKAVRQLHQKALATGERFLQLQPRPRSHGTQEHRRRDSTRDQPPSAAGGRN